MIYYRKHAKLLERAVAIFGDIIDNAYLSTEYRCIHINDVISDKVLIREVSRYM